MAYSFKKQSKTKEPENSAKAYEYAVFLLSLKLRTIGEVLSKMQSRGYGEVIIADVVERLKDQHYLDDQRYAEIFLENLKAYKNLGYYGIKKKFMEKKLPAQIIESVLADGYSVVDEIKVAKRFLNKLNSSGVILRSASDEESLNSEKGSFTAVQDDADMQYQTFNEDASKQKQKLANRLKSRGFRGDVIARLMF